MPTTPTTLRQTTLHLPVAPVGPENPLPPLKPLDEMHTVEERDRAQMPPDMARQVGYEPLRSVLPARILDGYTRERTTAALDALVLENDRLRVTVLPGLGGRIHSLHHKPTGRELLYTNPVFQPADFALNGAWYSGGVEWNIGATGHTTLSVAPLHAARVPAPDGGCMLRLWEWERLRDTPFQVDLWLPEGSDFLYVGARVRNPHSRTVPVYWWSNIAVPEDEHTRTLVPADETWYFAYERRLRRIPVPEWDGVDRTYALRSAYPADYFYEIERPERKWIAHLDAAGTGLVQTSTDLLGGRKLFVWGHGPGGRRWQEWLTEPGTGGYAEIQAGLARTQLEHVRLGAGGEFAWLEAYGPLAADPETVHGEWGRARAHTAERLEAALPRADVDAAYEAWRPYADAEPLTEAGSPTGLLAAGSGWGALELARRGYELPGTPFPSGTLGEEQRPWLELLHQGRFTDDRPADGGPAGGGRLTADGGSGGTGRDRTGAGGDRSGGAGEPAPETGLPAVPGPSLVSGAWRARLECAPPGPLTDYHLGVAQWHGGDLAQAVRSWERSVEATPTFWSLRCLAFADAYDAATGLFPERAADRYLAALELARSTRDLPAHALAALVREAVPVLLADGRTDGAADALAALPDGHRARGRFRLLYAQVLLARGERDAARAVFDAGFEVDDLREGDEVLSDTWAALTGPASGPSSEPPSGADARASGSGTASGSAPGSGTTSGSAPGAPSGTAPGSAQDDPLPARYDFRMRPA